MTEISTPAIIAENISKTFNPLSKSPVPALKDISFRVEKGEIVGLIGPNGAGKTTLLRILLGFLNADSGRVTILGEHPESLAVRAVLGYQADSQFRTKFLSVETFLQLHASLLNHQHAEEQVYELLAEFDLENAEKRSLAALSKGMRQKLELILAFLGTPQVVFLDEPTASLDPPSVFQLRDFLALRKKSHTTVFFSSHNLTEVEHVCDRVLFINQGAIVGEYKLKRLRRGFLEKAFRRHLVEGKSS